MTEGLFNFIFKFIIWFPILLLIAAPFLRMLVLKKRKEEEEAQKKKEMDYLAKKIAEEQSKQK